MNEILQNVLVIFPKPTNTTIINNNNKKKVIFIVLLNTTLYSKRKGWIGKRGKILCCCIILCSQYVKKHTKRIINHKENIVIDSLVTLLRSIWWHMNDHWVHGKTEILKMKIETSGRLCIAGCEKYLCVL